jgi:hypothetical protein
MEVLVAMRSVRLLPVGLLVAGLVVSLSTACGAEVDKYLPDDSDVVVVLNIRQLTEAPLIKKHAIEQLKGLLRANNDANKVFEALGFDPFKDLTSVTLAAAGIGPDAKGLALAHGTFDTAKFKAKAEEVAKDKAEMIKIHKEGDHTLYEVKPKPDEDKRVYIGILDGTTIAASDDKDRVLGAFAVAAGKKQGGIKKDLKALIEKVDGNQSLWMVAPGSALAKAAELGGDPKAKQSVEKIDSITAALMIDKDVKLALAVNAKSTDNAKELSEEIKEGLNQAKGILAVLAGNMKELAPAVEIVDKLKVDTEGSTVTMKAEVTEEFIEKSLKKD